jgi:AcrR family transcriptional regulator
MGKKPDPRIKAQLIERIAAYLLQHGVQDLSLRPLAEALDTTARMLLYHFGSREQLIVEVLTYGQFQQQAIFAHLLVGTVRPSDGLRALWQHFTSDELTPLIRLTFEVEVLAMQGKTEYHRFARDTLHSWTALISTQLAGTSPETATLVVSVFSGLLLDFHINADRQRVDTAFEKLLTLLEERGAI